MSDAQNQGTVQAEQPVSSTPEYPSKVFYKPGENPVQRPVVDITTNKAKRLAERLAQKAKEAKNDGASEGQGTDGQPPSEQSNGQAASGGEGVAGANGEAAPGGDLQGSEGKDGHAAEEKSPDQTLKAQFSALARAEKRLREQSEYQNEQVKKQLEEIEAKKAEIQEIYELKDLAERDKYALIDKLGLDINEWASIQLGRDGQPEKTSYGKEYSDILSRLETIEKRNEELEAQRQDYVRRQNYEVQKQQAVAQIDEMLQNSPDEYEFTRAKGGAETVFATIEDLYQRTGKLWAFEDAAKLVENYLEEEAKTYLGVSKIKKLSPANGEAAQVVKEQSGRGDKAPAPQASKTVNQAPDRVSSAQLSRAERRKRAAAILAG